MHEKLHALFAVSCAPLNLRSLLTYEITYKSRYPALRSQFPGLGRRKWQLKAIHELWEALVKDPDAIDALNATSELPNPDDFMQDPDPFDDILAGPEQGLLLRTDFSNDDAWQAFCEKVAIAEQEIADAVKPDEPAQVDAESSSTKMDVDEMPRDSDDESSDEEGSAPGPMIKVVDSPSEKSLLENISNLSALHLLNDLDIRKAPDPPKGQKRYQPPSRLIDVGGWQEIYTGKTLWIYDAKSNADQCVRLLSQEGDIYGTATGDSWRVQGSHICELQFNMSFLGMKINFGGLDRWDLGERKKNLEQSNAST